MTLFIRRITTGIASSRRSLHSGASSLVIIDHDSSTKVTHLKLNRLEGRNSFSKQMLQEFCSALESIKSNEQSPTNVLVVSSNIPKVFCAGADLKERASMPEDQVAGFVSTLRDAFTMLERIPIPTIAAIEGIALGGGLELALCCDLRVAGTDAVLGLPETALAIIPGAGGTQRLPRLIGSSKAKELIFLAKRLSAAEAMSYGIVNECVAAGKALPRAHELALSIAANGPLALRMAKRAVDEGMHFSSLTQGLEVEKNCYAAVVPTADRREGLLAFMEKRKPQYTGK